MLRPSRGGGGATDGDVEHQHSHHHRGADGGEVDTHHSHHHHRSAGTDDPDKEYYSGSKTSGSAKEWRTERDGSYDRYSGE